VILVERIPVRRLGDPGETTFNRSSYVALLNHPGHGAFVLFSVLLIESPIHKEVSRSSGVPRIDVHWSSSD
jgi:hypothetical protein